MSENSITSINIDGGEGQISFADDVVAVIAGLAATEVEGVAGMAGTVVDGITEILGRKNLSRGVRVEVGKEEAAVDIDIIADYGINIPNVARKVQDSVKRAIENMTGLTVVEVNINVLGVSTEKDRQLQTENQARVK